MVIHVKEVFAVTVFTKVVGLATGTFATFRTIDLKFAEFVRTKVLNSSSVKASRDLQICVL